MLISDFTLKARNVAKKGDKPRLEIWQTAAGGNMTAVGYKDGKKYQIKLHASEPKWYYTDKAIERKQQELNRAKDSDKPRIQHELASLKKNKPRDDRRDELADGYFNIKTSLIRALNAIGDPLIVAPIAIWKQEIDFRGNGVFAVEAAPWAEHAYMGGDNDNSPLVFSRDPTQKQQYELMASLAGRVAKLHEHGIIHGDLKIGNTLMVVADGRFQAALIDFDAAILLNDLYSRRFELESWYKALGGTYFSPEAFALFEIVDERDESEYKSFDLKTVTEKSDIFGLGVTVYEYFFGRADMGKFIPFVNADGERFLSRDYCEAEKLGYKLALPDTVNDFLYALIGWMLDPIPQNRPTARQVENAFQSGEASAVPERYRRGGKNKRMPEQVKANIEEPVPAKNEDELSAAKELCDMLSEVKKKKLRDECDPKLVEQIKADVQKIKARYSEVMPEVPSYASDGKVYTFNSTANMFIEVSPQAAEKRGVTVLALSTVFEPYADKTFDELSKMSTLFKWCSLNVFKAHGLIAADAQAVFIVDDGYTDFGVDKTAFEVMAKKHRAFSPDDDGRVFFSESAMKKLKSILK